MEKAEISKEIQYIKKLDGTKGKKNKLRITIGMRMILVMAKSLVTKAIKIDMVGMMMVIEDIFYILIVIAQKMRYWMKNEMDLKILERKINESIDGVYTHEAIVINYLFTPKEFRVRAAVDTFWFQDFGVPDDDKVINIDFICLNSEYLDFEIPGVCAEMGNEILFFGPKDDGTIELAFSLCVTSTFYIKIKNTKIIWKVIKEVPREEIKEADLHDYFNFPGSCCYIPVDPKNNKFLHITEQYKYLFLRFYNKIKNNGLLKKI